MDGNDARARSRRCRGYGLVARALVRVPIPGKVQYRPWGMYKDSPQHFRRETRSRGSSGLNRLLVKLAPIRIREQSGFVCEFRERLTSQRFPRRLPRSNTRQSNSVTRFPLSLKQTACKKTTLFSLYQSDNVNWKLDQLLCHEWEFMGSKQINLETRNLMFLK